MRIPHQNKATKYLLALLTIFMILAYYMGEQPDKGTKQSGNLTQKINTVTLSARAKNHILYGDDNGGGHKYGIGKPCKSEFPKNWDEEKIITTVKKIAANDNLNWERQNNGYFVSEQNEGNIRVRVVMGDQRQNIITAYPVNVKRNPCPTEYKH